MADTLEQILAELKKINKEVGVNNEANKKSQEQIKTSTELLKEQNKEYERLSQQIEAELKLQEDLAEQLETADATQKKLIKEKIKFSKEYTKSLKEQTKEAKRFSKALAFTKGAFDVVTKAATKYNQAVAKTTGIDFSKVFSYDAAKEGALALDELGKSILKVGGLSGDFRKEISAVSKEMQHFGVVNQDVVDAQIQLMNSMSRFTMASRQQQAALRNSTLRYQKARNAGAEYTEVVNILTTAFGKSNEEAMSMADEMGAAAEAMGVGSQRAFASFAAATPRLLLSVDNVKREFLKLTAAAKVTGVEVTALQQVSQGFDTFEDAARKTSQLNAMFGTQLNSVEMLRLNDKERIDLIRERLQLQGKDVKNLEKYEKLSLAGILQVDTKTLTQAFANVGEEVGNLAGLGEDADVKAFQESLNKAVSIRATLQSTMNSLNNMIGEKLIPSMESLSKGLLNRDFQKEMEQAATFLEPFYAKITEMGIKSAQEVGAEIAKVSGGMEAAKTGLDMGGTGGIAGLILSTIKEGIGSLLGTVGGIGISAALASKFGKGKVATEAATQITKSPLASKTAKFFMNPAAIFTAISAAITTGAGILAHQAMTKHGAYFSADPYASMDEDFGGTTEPQVTPSAGIPAMLAREPEIKVPEMLMKPSVPTPPTVPSTSAPRGTDRVSRMADQIADRVAKSFNPVINMTAYVGDKQTTVRLVKDALNSSYPLGRATTGG